MHRVREKKEKTLSPVRDVVVFGTTSVFFSFRPSLGRETPQISVFFLIPAQ